MRVQLRDLFRNTDFVKVMIENAYRDVSEKYSTSRLAIEYAGLFSVICRK